MVKSAIANTGETETANQIQVHINAPCGVFARAGERSIHFNQCLFLLRGFTSGLRGTQVLLAVSGADAGIHIFDMLPDL